jgi:hypothetical protein
MQENINLLCCSLSGNKQEQYQRGRKKVIKENIRNASFYGNEMAPPPIVPSRATHPLFISFAYSHI